MGAQSGAPNRSLHPGHCTGLSLLAAQADAPVLVTEGEKAAEAARLAFPTLW